MVLLLDLEHRWSEEEQLSAAFCPFSGPKRREELSREKYRVKRHRGSIAQFLKLNRANSGQTLRSFLELIHRHYLARTQYTLVKSAS